MRAALTISIVLMLGPAWAQDTTAWIGDMNRRMAELARREMTWRPTLLVTDSGGNWQPVRTVEDAILLLCAHDLKPAQEIAIYDFLDSAATELWRMHTPVLLSTCHHILHPEQLAAEEKDKGFVYVCVFIACSPERRPRDGIDVFNHRTQRLLNLTQK
jgi:hypothetical protein